MAACFCCLRCCWGGSGFNSGHVQLKELPTVKLDTSQMGNDVVIVKNGKRICGTGAGLSNAPIVQDKAYFEVKIQSTGVWGVGLATKRCNLNCVPLGENTESWGLAYDHVQLNFLLNGKPLNLPFTGMKGTLYPVFYVDEGAVMDIQFDKFYHQPPDGFDSIMIEQSLL
ncbi:hypothetical protein FSP39_015929 [Pinctada imbricata]|uniref:SPRY domain-containing protein n=1 Tax=Pinctada imbricata TaxID=66713 RepID=A0AA88XZL3_PINIB|nr:hypothetical protein FSP39_015929 [Pinctada imbricata]